MNTISNCPKIFVSFWLEREFEARMCIACVN